MRRARTLWIVTTVIVVAALVYLRDPSWMAGVSSGLSEWQHDEQAVEFRRMSGHASFFLPSSATTAELPLRAVFTPDDERPIVVQAAVNDRPVGQIVLSQSGWTSLQLFSAPVESYGRRLVRIDLHVPRLRSDGTSGVDVGRPRLH